MKRIVTASLAALALAACFDDPTSGLRGGPATLRLSSNAMFIAPGDSVNVTGHITDQQGNQVVGTLTFTTGDAAVAATGADTSLTQPGTTEAGGYVKGVGAGQTWIQVSGAGVSDSIRVTVVPAVFSGTIAPASGAVGTVFTVTMPSGVTLNPANFTLRVGGGDAFITASSANSFSFVAPEGADQTLEIGGLVLTAIGLDLPVLNSTQTIDVTDANEPGNGGVAGGAVIAVPTVVGDSIIVDGSISGSDADDFWTVTPAAGGTLVVTVVWASDVADLDAYMLNSAGTLAVCGDDFLACAAAGSSYPETGTATVSAATTYRIYVNLFDDHGAGPQPYRLIIKRTS